MLKTIVQKQLKSEDFLHLWPITPHRDRTPGQIEKISVSNTLNSSFVVSVIIWFRYLDDLSSSIARRICKIPELDHHAMMNHWPILHRNHCNHLRWSFQFIHHLDPLIYISLLPELQAGEVPYPLKDEISFK